MKPLSPIPELDEMEAAEEASVLPASKKQKADERSGPLAEADPTGDSLLETADGTGAAQSNWEREPLEEGERPEEYKEEQLCLWDRFGGQDIRIFVPRSLYCQETEPTEEVLTQRVSKARPVLPDLSKAIGARSVQRSTKYTLGQINVGDKKVDLTSLKQGDEFLGTFGKPQHATAASQLRAHLKDVPRKLREGLLPSEGPEEEPDPTVVIKMSKDCIKLRERIQTFGITEPDTPVDFKRQIEDKTQYIEAKSTRFCAVGKPGSRKSLTCNRLAGFPGERGPFFYCPETRDHGTKITTSILKTAEPGLHVRTLLRRKSVYEQLVERRFKAGSISPEELRDNYHCKVMEGPEGKVRWSSPDQPMAVRPIEEVIPGVNLLVDPVEGAHMYSSGLSNYTPAEQLMIAEVEMSSNAWPGLDEGQKLVDCVGFLEAQEGQSDFRSVTDDIVREDVKGANVIIPCTSDRVRTEEDGNLLAKLGLFDGTPDTFPILVCPDLPSVLSSLEKVHDDNVNALAGAFKKPEQLVARNVPNVQHLIQLQEPIIQHISENLFVMQPVTALNSHELKEDIAKMVNKAQVAVLVQSISIWITWTLMKLRAFKARSAAPVAPRAEGATYELKCEKKIRDGMGAFTTQFAETIVGLEVTASELLEEASRTYFGNVWIQLEAEGIEDMQQAFEHLLERGAVSSDSNIYQFLFQVFDNVIARGRKDLVEHQSAILKALIELRDGKKKDLGSEADASLLQAETAGKLAVERAAQGLKNGPSAMEDAIQWTDSNRECAQSGRGCDIREYINKVCKDAVREALTKPIQDEAEDHFVSILKRCLLESSGRTRLGLVKPLVLRILEWAETTYTDFLIEHCKRSLEMLKPDLDAKRPVGGGQLQGVVSDLAAVAKEVKEQAIKVSNMATHKKAYEEQALPKPLIRKPQTRDIAQGSVKLLPEVDFQQIEVVKVPGLEIALSDLVPEPAAMGKQVVTGRMEVGEDLLPIVDAYNRATTNAVKERGAAGPKTTDPPRVVFYPSELQPGQRDSSVRFDFRPSHPQGIGRTMWSPISYVVCRESEAENHRRLLNGVEGTTLVTVPNDSKRHVYYSAAQIVYWLLHKPDLEEGYGSYFLMPNNVEEIIEVSPKSFATQGSSLQRWSTFAQQVLHQERQRKGRALLAYMSVLYGPFHLALMEALNADNSGEIVKVMGAFGELFPPNHKRLTFPKSEIEDLVRTCKGPHTRELLQKMLQHLETTVGVSCHLARFGTQTLMSDAYPDNVFQPRTAAPATTFWLVDARGTAVVSPLHVAGFNQSPHEDFLPCARRLYKPFDALGWRSLATPTYHWRQLRQTYNKPESGFLYKQPVDALSLTKIEKALRNQPTLKSFSKPEGALALEAKLPASRTVLPSAEKLRDSGVRGNGLALAIVSSALKQQPRTLRSQVGAHVKKKYASLKLPRVTSPAEAGQWANEHAQEGSGLELDFVHAAASCKGINLVVALVNKAGQLRYYQAIGDDKKPEVSYVFGFADGVYSPIGWRKDEDDE
ncbi:hypothetical protein KFL_001160110 [Klebsormidium nitens]|uniref:Uncharacterized protein n=1 Tax=Klebsormidium nitens TaxID=105231 RepID=A0A1Y1HZG4_KLENI|nr:hypothetical protein KFL_001160110 [Klebsormidium nitens]|eukprot:GAQ82579.1 hypothetical protein KFL_001160110 [Klebsormidium nitens]